MLICASTQRLRDKDEEHATSYFLPHPRSGPIIEVTGPAAGKVEATRVGDRDSKGRLPYPGVTAFTLH